MTPHKFNLLPLALLATCVFTLGGCTAMQEDPENEIDIDLADVPAGIMEAAREALPGIEISEAEFEEEDGAMIYELEGMLGEQRYEIEIGQDGEIIEIEEIEEEEEEDEED